MLRLLRRALGRLARGKHPVVIVSGLPRSGTSMMMRMLEAGGIEILTDALREADIDNPKGYYEYERIKDLEHETDKSYIRNARGKALKVISFLLKDLPDDNHYHILFMRRDIDEVLASQNKMTARLRGDDDMTDDASLRDSYLRDIARARLLGRKRRNFELMEVSYGDTIAAPEKTAERVQAFLGRHLDTHAMTAVVDPTLYRNRRCTPTGTGHCVPR